MSILHQRPLNNIEVGNKDSARDKERMKPGCAVLIDIFNHLFKLSGKSPTLLKKSIFPMVFSWIDVRCSRSLLR
jgi:hypothetical protein